MLWILQDDATAFVGPGDTVLGAGWVVILHRTFYLFSIVCKL